MLKKLICRVLLAIACTAGCAQTVNGALLVDVVYAGDAAPASSVFRALESAPDVVVKSTDVSSDPLPAADLYVAAGPAALRALSDRHVQAPVLATFISHLGFASLTRSSTLHVSAVYADPNPALQFKLINLLVPNSARVGILFSPQSAALIDSFEILGKEYEVDVTPAVVGDARDLGKALNRVATTDVVLAVPDSALYNGDTLSTILLTTYRHNQLLIGFSPGMVRAGAAATVNYTAEQVADEARRMIAEYHSTKSLPRPRYPSQFDVVVNERVLESLNIPFESKSSLLSKLKRSTKR